MAIYHQLDHQITCIDTQHISNNFVASYLIESHGLVAFVDTGSHLSVPNLLNVLAEKNIHISQVKFIFVTHIHLDHVGGAGKLIKHLPNAKVVVHPKGAKHLINPDKLKAGVIDVYGQAFFKQYLGDIMPIDQSRIIIAENGDFNLGKRTLTLINTPGHARHHYCLWDKTSKGIFSGDTLGVSYRELNTRDNMMIFPPTSPTQFEPEVWKHSINHLLSYQPQYAYLTHFCRIKFNLNIAQKLRQSIDDFSNIALIVAKQYPDKKDRYKMIKLQLTNYLLKQLKHYQCPLDDKKQIQVLRGDLEICTQGLIIWLGKEL